MLEGRIASTVGRRARRGFSLAELVVVIVILGVVAAVAVPRFAGAESDFRARAGAAKVAGMLERAASEARARSMPVAIRFDDAGDRVRIRTRDGDVLLEVDLTNQPYRLDLAGVRIDEGGDTITFDGYGYADLSGIVLCRVGDAAHAVIVDSQRGTIETGTETEAEAFGAERGLDA